MAAIDQLLRIMLEKGGSDLHLTVGLPPKSRISGSLQPIGNSVLDAKAMAAGNFAPITANARRMVANVQAAREAC